MRIRFFLAAVLAIPIVFAAILIWTLTGSAESAYRPSSSSDANLPLARPVSRAQIPPTLSPASATPAPARVVTESPTREGLPSPTLAAAATPTPV